MCNTQESSTTTRAWSIKSLCNGQEITTNFNNEVEVRNHVLAILDSYDMETTDFTNMCTTSLVHFCTTLDFSSTFAITALYQRDRRVC